MKPLIPMRAALSDPDLFGRLLGGESWLAWRVQLIAAFGEELTTAERTIFTALTGREREPMVRVDEWWNIMGRRSGKTRIAGSVAAYVAALCDHSDKLAPGERGVLPIMSASTWQAGKAFAFVSGIFNEIPALKALVTNETADTLSLSSRVDIECRPASFRTVRGSTFIAAVADEVAFWRSDAESRNPDAAILAATRPALATTGGPLIVISSPYAQSDELWNVYKRDFGPQGDPLILVARAASRTMNPTLSEKVVARAYEKDAESARAEYGGEFRIDLVSFVDAATLDAAVTRGVSIRPPLSNVSYVGFVDPSGGSSDSFTLAIAHAEEGGSIVLDLVAERRPPLSPAAVIVEFAALLKQYRVACVVGDRYGGEFPREQFRAAGVEYRVADKNRSDLYLETLSLLNSGRAALLDNPRMVAQFLALERRTARSGKDQVDHGPGGHDDVANAVAGALVAAAAPQPKIPIAIPIVVTSSTPGFGGPRGFDDPIARLRMSDAGGATTNPALSNYPWAR